MIVCDICACSRSGKWKAGRFEYPAMASGNAFLRLRFVSGESSHIINTLHLSG